MYKKIVYLLILAMLPVSNSYAEDEKSSDVTNEQKQAEVEADNVEYDSKAGKVIAEGHVVVKYDNRQLKAHKVSYDQNNDKISADRNVHVKDDNDNEYFADSAEVDGKIANGEITNLSGHLKDKDALFAADKATLENKNKVILDNAVYSTCKVCPRTNDGKAFWQLTADNIVIDNETGIISYKGATIDFFDVPVFYLPYLTHPTPKTKRKSGFLVPSYSQVSTLGISVKIPYFYNLAPNMDFTFSPIFTTEEGVIANGEFRHLTENGKYEISGSITNPKERNLVTGDRLNDRDIRGHIEGKGYFSINDKWSWGFNGKRSTDRTYLQRYKFGNEDLLTSKLFAQRINKRDYIDVRSVTFQGLNENDNNDITPLILPQVRSHNEYNLKLFNSKLFLDTNSLHLTRDTGAESRRISAIAGWEIPLKMASGHLLSLKTSLRGDGYSVENVIDRSGNEKDGLVGRFIPEAQLSWSFPLVKTTSSSRLFIEPLVDVIISPNGGNPDKISNEDSQELELSDVNLFSNNRFSGVDRIEGGFRTNYGFRGSYHNNLGELSFLLGQSFRGKNDDNFSERSGLNDNFSDYAGRVSLTLIEDLELFYRFRMDKDDFKLRRNEIGSNLTFDKFSVGANYIILDEEDETFDRQELTGTARFDINENWSINAYGRRNLTDSETLGGWINGGAGLIYENECIKIATGWNREFTRDADIEPSISYTLKVSFKGLGQ